MAAPVAIGRDISTRPGFMTSVAIIGRYIRQQSDLPSEVEAAISYLERRFMKVGVAQEVLGVKSPTTIKKWIRHGRFPGAYQTAGGQWLLPTERVYELLDAGIRAQMEARQPGPVAIEGCEGDPFEALGL